MVGYPRVQHEVTIPLQGDSRRGFALSCRDLLRCCGTQEWLGGACVLPRRSPFLHRQHDSELCFAAHHSRVRFARFFERVCLNHRAHSAEFGEAQCVFLIR
jgi:hypothetical protein